MTASRESSATDISALCTECGLEDYPKLLGGSFGYECHTVSENGRIIAALFLQTVGDESDVLGIATLPEYRRRGCAEKLLRDAAKGRKLTLEVRESNFPAIALYKKVGFTEIRVIGKYYGNENGILMAVDMRNENTGI